MVCSLKVGCILASKVSLKAAYIYGTNLVKQVRYKANNYIKFRTNKEFFSSVILVQEFFLNPFCLVLLIYCVIQGLYNNDLFIPFNLYALVIQEGLQVTDGSRVACFKDSLYKVRKVLLVLLLQVNIYKLKVSVLKGFEFNVVVNIRYRYKVDSLPLLVLTFIDLLFNIYHACIGQYVASRRVLQLSIKVVDRSVMVCRKVRGLYKGSVKRPGY